MSNSDFLKQRYNLLFKDLPAADGGNYGVRVIGYIEETDDYLVMNITWNTKELITKDSEPRRLNAFKMSYRYSPLDAITTGTL